MPSQLARRPSFLTLVCALLIARCRGLRPAATVEQVEAMIAAGKAYLYAQQ